MRMYFIYDGQDQLGPFTIEEIKKQKLSNQTLVWFEGLSDWTTAENIQELASAINTPPPPPGKVFNQPSLMNENSAQHFSTSSIESASNWKPYLLTAGMLAIIFIGYLIYTNNSQATVMEHLQKEQQKIDIAIQTKDNVEQQREAERKKLNEEITRKNREFRNNWSTYINVTNNKYKYSELGGIYGLFVIATNNSDYMLEEIMATVTYIKADGGIWKTIEIPIYNIAPHSDKGVGVPDVERGTSVEIGVNSISSQAAHFCYTPGNWANRMEDPYFCN